MLRKRKSHVNKKAVKDDEKAESAGLEEINDVSESELQKLSVDQIDFSIVKKVLADHLSEDIGIDQSEPAADGEQRFLELEVETLEQGLKKASELLELDVRELKYRVLDTVFIEDNGMTKELQRIEFSRKLTTGETKLYVSEDNMTAVLQRLYPRKQDGTDTTYQDILDLLKKKNVTYGVKLDAIKNAVTKVQENLDVLADIEIASGKHPVKGQDAECLESIFQNESSIQYSESEQRYLKELFSMETIEGVSEHIFPVVPVRNGEVIAVTSLPTDGEEGRNLSGEILGSVKGDLKYLSGDYVTKHITEESVTYTAQEDGYLELDENVLRVQIPVWISPDKMEAYYIKMPYKIRQLTQCDSGDILRLMNSLGITEGIDTGKIYSLTHVLRANPRGYEHVCIAEGNPPEKGADARIELFFEKDGQPGKLRADGSIDYRELNIVKTVKAKQLIAAKYFAKDGTPGKDITGKSVEAPTGEDIPFNALNNVNAVMGENKILYYATIEGKVDIVGGTGISVNQVYDVKGNVDFSTGNIDFNGDVNVNGSVMSGFKIYAEGNINVKGTVNQGATLEAKGNITIKEGVIGRDDTFLKARGNVEALYLQASKVEAGNDVIIKDYILNSIIKAQGRVITPSLEKQTLGKGSIMGGTICALKGITANSIGSEVSANTRIITGVDFQYDKKLKDINKALEYCDYQVSKISKSLRFGVSDMKKLKESIKKLPREKQKPFLDAFQKLREVNALRDDILEKRQKMMDTANSMSQKVSINVHEDLYARVYIQIGANKMRTEQDLRKVKLSEHANGKEIVMENLVTTSLYDLKEEKEKHETSKEENTKK